MNPHNYTSSKLHLICETFLLRLSWLHRIPLWSITCWYIAVLLSDLTYRNLLWAFSGNKTKTLKFPYAFTPITMTQRSLQNQPHEILRFVSKGSYRRSSSKSVVNIYTVANFLSNQLHTPNIFFQEISWRLLTSNSNNGYRGLTRDAWLDTDLTPRLMNRSPNKMKKTNKQNKNKNKKTKKTNKQKTTK